MVVRWGSGPLTIPTSGYVVLEVCVKSFEGVTSRLRIPINFVFGCIAFDVSGPAIEVGPGGQSGTHTSIKWRVNLRSCHCARGLYIHGTGNFRRCVIKTDGTLRSYVPRQLSLIIFVIERD